jgi:hypothetical protein
MKVYIRTCLQHSLRYWVDVFMQLYITVYHVVSE